MPVPSLITDLSTTPASNSAYINGGVDPGAVLDDHLRTAYAFIRTNYNSILTKQDQLTAGSIPASWLASGAAVSNIGYTPVNRAGDSGITGALVSSSTFQGSSLIAKATTAESTERHWLRGLDNASTTRAIFGMDSDNAATLWTYNAAGAFQSAFKFTNGNQLSVPNASLGVVGLNLGSGNGSISARAIQSATHMHLDAAAGSSTYLNFYSGAGIYFGNGASGNVGSIANNGSLSVAGSIDNGFNANALGTGYAGLIKGNTIYSGYIEFRAYTGVRQGYLGFNDGTTGMQYDTENFGIHNFQQDIVFNSGIGLRRVGYRCVPPKAAASGYTLVAGDEAKCIELAGPATIPANVLGTSDDNNLVMLYNNTAADVVITQGAGLTLRKDGTALTGNVTLKQRGSATVRFRSGTEAIISGQLV